jgi:hypothetical protein
MNIGSGVVRAVEPWYDWGSINVVNMDAQSFDDQVEGEVRYFDIQWFGIHLGFQIGRTPSRRAALPCTGRNPRRSIAAGIARLLDGIEAAVCHPICDAALVALAVLAVVMGAALILSVGDISPAGAIETRVDL